MGANEEMHRQICRSWSRLRAERVLSAVRKSVCLELENMLKSEVVLRWIGCVSPRENLVARLRCRSA